MKEEPISGGVSSGTGSTNPDGRAQSFSPPALTNGAIVPQPHPRGGGFVIGPATFMVIVFFQAMLLVATAVALTLIVARPDLLRHLTGDTALAYPGPAAWPGGQGGTRADTGGATRLVLDLPRPIQVVAGQPSNLGFRLLPPGEYRGTLVLTMKGLPDGSVVSGARKLGADTWSVDAGRELTLSLTVPASTQGPFELDIGLRRPEGTLITNEITTLIALPEGRTSHDPERDAMSALLLLESARSFQQAGDVRSTRVLLQSAAQRGNAQAALELGQTFDQAAGSGDGAVIDAPKAMYWYIEAKRLGHPDAEVRLNTLIQRTSRKEPDPR